MCAVRRYGCDARLRYADVTRGCAPCGTYVTCPTRACAGALDETCDGPEQAAADEADEEAGERVQVELLGRRRRVGEGGADAARPPPDDHRTGRGAGGGGGGGGLM